MKHTIEIPHTSDNPNTAILISSANTTTHVDWSNTRLYACAWDPEVDFCIERDTKEGEIERIFTDDRRVFNVLHELGFTAIITPFASKEQLYEYRGYDNETKLLEWDVLDTHDGESIYLKGLMLEAPTLGDEECVDIPRKSDVYEIEDVEGDTHYFDQARTTVNTYHDYPEMNHILTTSPGDNGIHKTEIVFNEPDLFSKLTDANFDTFVRRYPSREIVAAFREYQQLVFDYQAETLLDLPPSDQV